MGVADRPAKERAILRATSTRALAGIFAVALALVQESSSAFAQQPSRQPAPWSGIAPPAVIEGLPELRPAAPLEFSRAWLARMEHVRTRRAELHAMGELDDLAPAEAAALGAALAGTLRIPVIPVLYAGAAAPFAPAALADRLFGAGRGDTVSFAQYWTEVSSGLLRVEGDVAPWIRLPGTARHYLPREEYGWSRFGRIADLRRDAIRAADAQLDFRGFDNDGPDGVPDSGDDDGFVDFVALVYALPCPGDAREGGIWPHRAAMAPMAVDDISRASGRPLQVTDYVILPAVDPESCGPMHVGVLAHETGHALGLPDLYDYDGSSQGIGAWGLMGTGSHAARFSPAHLDAWSKEQLGWVRVTWISDTASLALRPVVSDAHVYRFDEGPASDRYLLIENRQQLGSDRYLPGSGMLVWEIDPERGELGAWNTDERRAAVRLVQADGREDLVRGRRADSGDPFPGLRENRQFTTHIGTGLEITAITDSAGDVLARLVPGGGPALVPSTSSLRLTAPEHGKPVRQLLQVERRREERLRFGVRTAAPWLRVERVGDALLLVADPDTLPPGVYQDTLRLVDSREMPLGDVIVSFHVAALGFSQIVATELPWSWGLAAHNGRLLHASYGWDPLGLRPRPRVLQLLEGSTHPHTLARIPADALYSPVVDRVRGELYVLARARDENLLYRIDTNGDAAVVAFGVGSQPAYGAALLPDGSVLVADWSGDVHRVTPTGEQSLFVHFNANLYQIATDDAGTLYAASYDGTVLRLSTAGEATVLQTGFEPGRLVTIAAQRDGTVFAAERGGDGRIIRIDRNGSREILYRGRGAHYYGLATDNAFIYALDLGVRQLLRIPLPQARALVADR